MKLRSLLLMATVVVGFAGLGYGAGSDPSVLYRMDSPFNGHLSVVDYNGTRYLVAQSRAGIMVSGSMNLTDTAELNLDYLQVMALLTALHEEPRSIFNLGLGAGSLVRFHLKQYPTTQIDSVEIDPAVVSLGKNYFLLNQPRHLILEGDGFAVLGRQTGGFDAIWIDLGSPKVGPSAYIKAEYLDILRSHLNSGGVLVANLGELRGNEPSSQSFMEVVKDYHRGYKYGIRIQSPTTEMTEALAVLQKLNKVNSKSNPSALLPHDIIAVGNLPALNCVNFWKTYEAWSKRHLLSLKWASRTDVCKDI